MTEETLDASEIVDGDVPENPHNNTSIIWKTTNLFLLLSVAGRMLCSIDKLLYLVRGKCRESGCDSFYEVSTEFQGCCLIVHGKCMLGHQFKWESSVAQANHKGSKYILITWILHSQWSFLATILAK